ncbi:glycosyltransferase involved in cell wall biosynthesis [Microbacterium sp. BE35]|uniref:glycosyltransferase family 4 protein n=1 Tax=Microbacterium sp. BE35 TaxID=2817773 RepID=UPI00285B8606|nr:glycosyltransferase family 4 protein [Microbacterium sp. BE35]MDR7188704.1 glycosyltransferase involved in cell wall biosynthesis [Microbacterium sp. BE35]
MSDKRIVFVSLAPGIWGAERSMLTLASALVEDDVEVALLCTEESVATAWEEATGTPAHLLATDGGARWKQVTGVWRQISRFASRADTIVLFSYVLAPGAITPRRWPNGRPSIVLDLHDTLTPGFGRLALSASARGMRRVISVSRFTGGQVIGSQSRVSVLTRPIAPLPFRGRRESAPMVVAVLGRVTPEKRPELLIDAVRDVQGLDVLIRGEYLAGEEYTRELQARGERALGSRFRLEGPRPWERALDGIDLLVVANANEPMGRTVLEAQLSGVIAIVPDRGGSSELVRPGETGFRYEAGSSDSLANVLREALRSDLTSIAEGARADALLVTDASRYARAYRTAINA